jgi:hypothetical protein
VLSLNTCYSRFSAAIMCVGISLDLRFDGNLDDELRCSPHPPPSAQNGVVKHGRLAFSHSSTVFRDGRFAAILDWGNSATPSPFDSSVSKSRLLGSYPLASYFPTSQSHAFRPFCHSRPLVPPRTTPALRIHDWKEVRQGWRSRRSSSRQ